MKRHACLLAALLCLSCGDNAPRPTAAATAPADEGMALAAFLAQRPASAAVRVEAQIDRPDGESGLRIRIAARMPDPVVYARAHVDRKTAVGAQLYEALKDGGPHDLILELRHAKMPGEVGNWVEVVHVVR